MPMKATILTLVFVIVVVAVILAVAPIRPHIRLQSEMPLVFVDAPRSWPLEKWEAEARVAKLYWNCAVNAIQWKYEFGSSLPENPPEEFTITAPGQRAGVTDSNVRLRYWRKITKVWDQPIYWKEDYSWKLWRWLEPLRSVAEWLKEHMGSAINPAGSTLSLREPFRVISQVS
jgi:hypothetical protein